METKMYSTAAASYHGARSRAARLWALADEMTDKRAIGEKVELTAIESAQALARREEDKASEIYRDPASWYEVIRHEHEPACQCAADPNREAMACRSCQCSARTTELNEVF